MRCYYGGVHKKVRAKLKAEGVDYQDYNKAIEVLSQCVAPVFCIKVYKDYIFSYNTPLVK